jgi:osmoprotectant transport system permease protein
MGAALTAKLGSAAVLAAGGLPQSFFHNRKGHFPCQATDALFCPQWAADNLHLYLSPAAKQLFLVVVSVAIGFAIAMALAILSHRRRWLVPPLIGATGVIYTIPSIAFFILLLPITGLSTLTGIIPLALYTLQIIYRNALTGLANVPAAAKDAGRGMGMTDSQLLRRVELPLAVPEIVAGLRVATVSTMALATLAFLGGAGGLGGLIVAQPNFKTNIILAGGLAILMAVVLDLGLLGAQRFATPWLRARAT